MLLKTFQFFFGFVFVIAMPFFITGVLEMDVLPYSCPIISYRVLISPLLQAVSVFFLQVVQYTLSYLICSPSLPPYPSRDI